jgi:acetyltransferase-like isoleucine patch superfamily enzyme
VAFLSEASLKKLGFAEIGSNVLISDKASIYRSDRISIGSNVRIDDFSVLSAGDGGIYIGNHIHIAVACTLIGAGRITMSDYSTISSRVAVYSSNDDYGGNALTNPMVPDEFRGVDNRDVFLGRHVIVGSGCVILPGVRLEEGVAVGALSLITKDCEAFGIYVGNPARRIKDRKRDLLEKEKKFVESGKL